jgi:hypothetical protein
MNCVKVVNRRVMNLDEFDKTLWELMKKQSPDLRPFVCEGSPLECEILIVGFNPAVFNQ